MLYLFASQVLTATSIIASSSRPLLSVDTVDVLLDRVRSLVAFGPRYCARSVPEEPIAFGKVVRACHGDWFSLPEDEGGPIYIYIRISVDREGLVKDRQARVRQGGRINEDLRMHTIEEKCVEGEESGRSG